jgi:lysylphosphatidylglycerol synthetase-like protein (DUF2156 family)
MSEITGYVFVAGWLIALALLAGAIGRYHSYQRESQGVLGWVVIAAALAVALSRLSDMETALILFVAALGLFGSFTIIGIPIWIGLRRLGRGKLVDAAVAGVMAACLGWWSFTFLSGSRDLSKSGDWTKILEPSNVLAIIALAGAAGGLVAWLWVYGRKVPANASDRNLEK